MTYSEKLRDPRWQKRRLEIMERDKFSCQHCADTASTLNVHHKQYKRGMAPWDYDDDLLITLCESCHSKLEDRIKATSCIMAENDAIASAVSRFAALLSTFQTETHPVTSQLCAGSFWFNEVVKECLLMATYSENKSWNAIHCAVSNCIVSVGAAQAALAQQDILDTERE